MKKYSTVFFALIFLFIANAIFADKSMDKKAEANEIAWSSSQFDRDLFDITNFVDITGTLQRLYATARPKTSPTQDSGIWENVPPSNTWTACPIPTSPAPNIEFPWRIFGTSAWDWIMNGPTSDYVYVAASNGLYIYSVNSSPTTCAFFHYNPLKLMPDSLPANVVAVFARPVVFIHPESPNPPNLNKVVYVSIRHASSDEVFYDDSQGGMATFPNSWKQILLEEVTRINDIFQQPNTPDPSDVIMYYATDAGVHYSKPEPPEEWGSLGGDNAPTGNINRVFVRLSATELTEVYAGANDGLYICSQLNTYTMTCEAPGWTHYTTPHLAGNYITALYVTKDDVAGADYPEIFLSSLQITAANKNALNKKDLFSLKFAADGKSCLSPKFNDISSGGITIGKYVSSPPNQPTLTWYKYQTPTLPISNIPWGINAFPLNGNGDIYAAMVGNNCECGGVDYGEGELPL